MTALADVGPLPRPPNATLSPLSPDGAFDLSSLPRVYARAAGAALKSPSPIQDARMKRLSGPSPPTRDGVAGDRKGKARATEMDAQRSNYDAGIASEPATPATGTRTYAPPRKPLSPNQLGRIAQSFGIAVPTLPLASPSSGNGARLSSSPIPNGSPGASSSRVKLDSYTRSSTSLLTVVPPVALLPRNVSTETEEERARWRRGRLIPLQPTYGGMLAAIAREFGLPSTVGLNLYLAHSHGSRMGSEADGASLASESDDPGPLITGSTWGALFGNHTLSSSRPTTPSNTPLKLAGGLGRDVAFPAGPQSAIDTRRSPVQLGLPARIRASSDQPPAPVPEPDRPAYPTPPATAIPSPIIGTVELDVDPSAPWLAEWLRAGRYRTPRPTRGDSPAGIRQLRLPQQVQDRQSPQFVRDLQSQANASRSDGSEEGDGTVSGDTTLHEDYDMPGSKRLKRRGTDDVPAIHLHGRELSNTSIPPEPREMNADLLASPINLGRGAESIVLSEEDRELLKRELAKRGSAVMMSDQLDDLEKLMRQLSPREIRLTSPRMLTPRTAAKVASANLTLPANPKAKSLSPDTALYDNNAAVQARDRDKTASTSSTSSSTSVPPAPQAHAAWAINKSGLSINTVSTVPSFDATTLSRPPIEAAYEDDPLPPPRPQWPAVPLGSPGSPTSAEDFFRPPPGSSVPPSGSPMSEETVRRMKGQAQSPPTSPPPSQGQGWRPTRPARPPTPDFNLHGNGYSSGNGHGQGSGHAFGHSSRPSYSLSPELVDQLRSPPTPQSPDAAELRKKGRSGSISLKGLRHMSSRGFGRKEKERPPALPLANAGEGTAGAGAGTVGLFKSTVSPKTSNFPGLKSGMGEWGFSEQAQGQAQGQGQGQEQGNVTGASSNTSNSLPSIANGRSSMSSNGTSHAQGNGFSRLFGFGNRKASDPPRLSSQDRDRSSKSTTASTVAGHGLGIGHGRMRSSDTTATGRSVSNPTKVAPAPAPAHTPTTGRASDSLNRIHSPSPPRAQGQAQVNGDFGPATSPASPRSVRRKPVPGSEDGELPQSESLGSLLSAGKGVRA